MKFKLSSSSSIVNFPSEDYGREEIADFINDITKEIKMDKFSEWTIIFYAVFGKANDVKILKGSRTYPTEKEKEISILIPIPSNEEVPWGIDKDRFAVRPPLDEKKFKSLNVDPKDFSNLKEYVIFGMKKGIETTLKDGITFQGEKIKI